MLIFQGVTTRISTRIFLSTKWPLSWIDDHLGWPYPRPAGWNRSIGSVGRRKSTENPSPKMAIYNDQTPAGWENLKGSEFSKGIRTPTWPKHSGEGFRIYKNLPRNSCRWISIAWICHGFFVLVYIWTRVFSCYVKLREVHDNIEVSHLWKLSSKKDMFFWFEQTSCSGTKQTKPPPKNKLPKVGFLIKAMGNWAIETWLVAFSNPSEKYARQNGNLPQIVAKIKNIWVATT